MFEPPQALVDAVRNRTAVPFIGAGVSVGTVARLPADQQFPDWNELILRLVNRLKAEKGENEAQAVRDLLKNPMEAAESAANRLGRNIFLAEMRAAFERSRPPNADLTAVEAIWGLEPPFVITTNYDRVLEWPLATSVKRILNSEPTPLAELGTVSSSTPRIWHLHGSIDSPDSVILTRDQYRTLYPGDTDKKAEFEGAFRHLQHLLMTRPFLFIGFSLAEPVLRQKIEEVLKLTGNASPISYLLLRKDSATHAQKAEFFNDYHVQVIEFEEFGEQMTEAIEAIRVAAWPDATSVSGWGLTSAMKPLVDELLQAVSGLVLYPDVIALDYNASKPEAWKDARTGGNGGVTLLRDAISSLGGAVNSARTGLPPLLNFVNRVRARAPERWTEPLTTWLGDAMRVLGVDPGLLALAPEPQRVPPKQVLVRIRTHDEVASQSLVPSGQWRVHAWSWSVGPIPETLFGGEGELFKDGDSEGIMYELIDQLEVRKADGDKTSIAFVVPAALAWLPLHNWRLSASEAYDPPIGAKYVVTVRALERMEKRLLRRRVKEAWEKFNTRAKEMLSGLDPTVPVQPGGVRAVLVDPAVVNPQLGLTIDRHGAQCVVLREPPSAASLDQLRAVLSTPTPAIVWCHPSTGEPADMERRMRELLQSVAIAELPRRIRDERSAAYRGDAGADVGLDLTLVWDDTEYLPPEYEPEAKARLELI